MCSCKDCRVGKPKVLGWGVICVLTEPDREIMPYDGFNTRRDDARYKAQALTHDFGHKHRVVALVERAESRKGESDGEASAL